MAAENGEWIMCKYVVIDLEMCKVPKAMRTSKYQWSSETIQIGAVLVDENLQIIDEFNTYVSPQFGFIDDYIKRLTGITNADVKNAVDMKSAMSSLLEWAPENAKYVSWSESDMNQIKRELHEKNIELENMDEIIENWIDCQKTFSAKMHEEGKNYSLKEALIAADIDFDENIHDGLVDARNTAELFIKMEKETDLKLNKYYKYAKTGVKDDSDDKATIGDLFPWLANLSVSE